jgi:hypothetical protein
VVFAENECSKNVTHKILHKGPIYRKLKCCQVGGLRSSAGTYAIDRGRCARSLITASKIPRRKDESDGN